MSQGITRRRETRSARDKAMKKQASADRKSAKRECEKAEKADGIAAAEALHTEANDALSAFFLSVEMMEGIEKRLEDAAQALEDAGYDAEDFKLNNDVDTSGPFVIGRPRTPEAEVDKADKNVDSNAVDEQAHTEDDKPPTYMRSQSQHRNQ